MASLLVWFINFLLSDQFVLMIGMFVIIGLIEWFFPAQQIPSGHYALNLRYAFVNVMVVTAITPFLSGAAAYGVQALGFGFINLRALGFGGIGGDLFAVLVGTLIWDFFQYWEHRLFHASPLFWQMHLLHHSDEHMNVTTEARHHVFELLLAPVFISIPTAIIFKVPPVNIAILSLIPYAWNYLAHANINLGFGPLWWLLVSPNYHRVHHSLAREHIDKNFANWFPIWDIAFGTAVRPRWRKCPSTGVAGVTVRSLTQAYWLPFRGWRRMMSRSDRQNLPSPQSK
jgi:sterol desaturase/sphingolipid hydroxylase (fatty acid hydroxylase superfamily)